MIDTLNNTLPWIGLILCYGILTHGIILLNDGMYWDWWMMEAWQKNRDRNSMRRFFAEVGMPNLYVEHWFLGGIRWRRMAYRLISLFSLQSIALFVFLIAVHTTLLNPPQAAIVALLLISYPAYAVTFDGHVSLQYTFKVTLFYAGCLLAVTTLNEFDALATVIFIASLALFFWSFTANSTLVYFGGFLLLYAWLAHARSPSGMETAELVKLSLMVVLPLAYWFTKEMLAPRHGYYKDYNRLGTSRLSIVREIAVRALQFGIDVPMIKAVKEAFNSGKVSLILVCLLLGSLAPGLVEGPWAIPATEAVTILLIGYGLVFLCALPFMLVGQMFSEGGWASKNFMLFHLPFALVVFGWLQLLPQSFGLVLVPLILLTNTLYIVKTHLLYIAISVRDKALMRWLDANPDLGAASVIKIRDSHWIEYPFERLEDAFRPAYLSFMIKLAWPDSRILAVLDQWGAAQGRRLTPEEIEEALEQTTLRYGFAPQVQPGPQYLITVAAPDARFATRCIRGASEEAGDVSPAIQSAMVRIALKYLYLKWFSFPRLSELFAQNFSISATRL